MKIAFISILSSGKDLSRCKLINLSIRIHIDGNLTEFQSLIKPVPALSKAEKATLPFDYNVLRKAPPLCDLTPVIIELLENTETVFRDRFSERVFKKAFKEIGYPMGSATYILERIYKPLIKSTLPFSLQNALEVFGIDQTISNNKEE